MAHSTETNPIDNPFEPPAGPPPGHIADPDASANPPSTLQDGASPPPLTNIDSNHIATSPSPASDTALRGSESPAQRERETVNDPRLVALRGMFPDYDDLILQSVLESAGGNQDRAIDTLLGMSDPDYRSEAPTQAEVPAIPLTQEQLDEQFARQLVMQEQHQQNEQWIRAQTDAGRPPPPTVHYATRPGSAQQGWTPQPGQTWSQGQPQSQERPSEFQEQFSKIAESGKKTIGNIFSKVKAKIQEFETGRPANAASSSQQPSQQQWNSPPQIPQQQVAYYDPTPSSQTTSAPVSTVASPGRTPPPLQGYDVGGMPSSPRTSNVQQQQLQRQPSPQPTTAPPPISATLDGGKLGLLPKRPVSLLRDPNAPGTASAGSATSSTPNPVHSHHDDDSDDGLEYAENPFETDNAGKK